jgi:hypothetical protein
MKTLCAAGDYALLESSTCIHLARMSDGRIETYLKLTRTRLVHAFGASRGTGWWKTVKGIR